MLIEQEEELETDIYECEEIQTNIVEKIAQLQFLLRSHTTRPSKPVPPAVTDVPTTSIPPVTPQPTNTSLQSVTKQGDLTRIEDTSQQPPTDSTATAPPQNPVSGYNVSRLPKLNIPMFTGDPLMWQPFWDSFDAAINSNPVLSNVQKLNYLRAQLQGDAARVISGFPLTNNNCLPSVELLRSRFTQPHKLVNAHMQALIDLPSPSNSLTSLQQFHDSIESHTRSLTALGKNSDSYDDLLVPITLGKLPTEIKRNLARERRSEEWTLGELQCALLVEIRILETTTSTSHKHPTASFLANAHNTSNPEIKRKYLCVYCSGSHPPSNCVAITDPKKRLEIVKQQRLCFNCLAHHKSSQCQTKNRCRNCKRKHHTSLCTAVDSEICSKQRQLPPTVVPLPTTETTTQNPALPNTAVTTISSTSQETILHSNNRNLCLLKTAVATVSSSNYRAEANVLFDEGSQRSFMSQSLANTLQLQLQPLKKEMIYLSAFTSQTPSPQHLEVAKIYLETKTGIKLPLSVLIVPTIAAPLQNTVQSQLTQLPYLQGLTLAHPVTSEKEFELSLLIGADHYWDVIEDHIIRGNEPTAMKSKLGYVLSGPLPQSVDTTTSALHIAALQTNEYDLQRFWAIEASGTSPSCNTDNEPIQSYIDSCILRNDDGSYTARFPWKENHPTLPSNRSM